MKTALLHYWLTNMRGGEKVLAALGEMFPEADIYTHAFGSRLREESGDDRVAYWRQHRVRESFVAKLPMGRRHPQSYLPLLPLASRSLDLRDYELIVSSESGPIKGVRKPAGARHVCYCHTPMRYVWDMYDEYYARANRLQKLMMKVFVRSLRRAELRSAESVDSFVANSRFVADRIRRIYGRESTVVYPPVDVEFFARPALAEVPHEGYYLFAGQLTGYKRPDLAIAACAKMGRKLVLVGDGNRLASIRRKNLPNVHLAGRVSDDELRSYYAHAKALLCPGLEDFGIVSVESQAAGVPVIAYGQGGALETVEEGRTGLFFRAQTVEALCAAIEEFESRSWSGDACRANAARFTKAKFVDEMSRVIS